MKRLSSRLKIALLSAGMSGLVLGSFAIAMWWLIQRTQMEGMDREIRTLISRHPGISAGRGNYERLARSLQFTFGEDYTNDVILLIRDAEGRTLHQSEHWPAELAGILGGVVAIPKIAKPERAQRNEQAAATFEGRGPGWGRGLGMGPRALPELPFTNEGKYFSAAAGRTQWRIGVLTNSAVTVVLGINEREAQENLARVRDGFVLAIPMALLLVGFGGWVVAGRALRPLNVIAETAERVTARGLDQRIPESPESPEAGRVVGVLNGMMDRLEASFQQATRFSADASHELKTPLAVMQGELENALQAAQTGSSEQQLFNTLLEEVQRLNRITQSLLLLAQADAGQLRLTRETLDLSGTLEAMVEDAHMLGAKYNLEFNVMIEPGVWVEGDRALLQTALFNLLSNAVKYCDAGGRISVRLNTNGTEKLVEIGNSGPGIPPEEREKLFQRFFRGHRSSSEPVDGLGLGLSLAREIIRAHRGDLVLKESRPGWTSFGARLA